MHPYLRPTEKVVTINDKIEKLNEDIERLIKQTTRIECEVDMIDGVIFKIDELRDLGGDYSERLSSSANETNYIKDLLYFKKRLLDNINFNTKTIKETENKIEELKKEEKEHESDSDNN